MPDLRQQSSDPPPLFRAGANDTSSQAGQRAALRVGSRRAKILAYLEEHGGGTIFEIADHLGVLDHQISGRFSELERDGYIEKSGQRRRKRDTDCEAEIYRLRRAAPSLAQPQTVEALGYPLTLYIDGEPYDRQELLPSEGYPGIPYARRADRGGLRLVVRVELIECPGCGRHLQMTEQPAGDKPSRVFRCNNPHCNTTWRTKAAGIAGRSPLLALVMETMP
jgi:DNA-binding Lrp family transcriptional regulator